MEFQRQGQKFICKGMQLTRPVDLLAEGKYAILRNVRAYVDGTIHPRLGLSSPTAALGAGPVHSIKRYFDSSTATIAEVAGSSTALYFNSSSIATGFSGNPLSFVPGRPYSSVENYLYVGDSSKQLKVSRSGATSNIGIAPSNTPVSAALGGPAYTLLEAFDSVGTWTNGGTAGAIGLIAAKRVNTTITYILYDTGNTGWACVNPAAMDSNIQNGVILRMAATENVRVESIHTAAPTTTIGSIKYDSGTSGLCTIQLTSPVLEGLERDAMLRIAAAENVRILSSTTGPDGIPSIRVSTTATRAAGDAVVGLPSFRAYFTTTRAAADTIIDEAFESTVTAGIGYVTNVASYNLSAVSNRPIQADDQIHVSVRLDNVALLTEGKIMFNVDTSTTFDKNYAYFPFTSSSLTPAVQNTLTTYSTQQTIIQKRLITEDGSSYTPLGEKLNRLNENDPSYIPEVFLDVPVDYSTNSALPTPGETSSGTSQWTELVFKVKDLIWIGADQSKNLSNINAIRLQVNVTASTLCNFDSLWVGGTYGLDSTTFPYNWTYCYVNKATGVRSNPAPPLRSGLMTSRDNVILTPAYSSDTQVDQIEWYRMGGTLPEWHFIGTQANSGTFTDSYSDQDINSNFGLEDDNFQPFPVADSPRTGTCDVVGTEVTRVSGDTFNTSWSRGSEIVINGVPTSLYASPSSTSRLSLEDNIGTLTGATFYLKSPTLLAQTMTSLIGPYAVSGITFMFGCKGSTLYFTKGNNFDSAPESNQLEVTSPQEPLIGGCVYNGQVFVFSTERMFRIIPNLSPDSLFEAQEVPVGKGLMVPWAIAVDDLIYFLSRDGLYQTNGESVKNISDQDLYPIFPHDGQVGVTVNGIAPPDYTQTASLRLAAGDGLFKFTFKDTGAVYRSLVYDSRQNGFTSLDTYTPQGVCHYWDEGGSTSSTSISTRERMGGADGKVYTVNSSTTDNGTVITSQVRTRSQDFGETRATKLFGDLMLDHAGTLTATVGVDNYSATLTPTTPAQVGRGQSIIDLLSGGGRKARNITLDLSFTDSTVVLYEWQPSFVPRPEDSKLRWMDFTDGGQPEAKFLQGIVLTADTGGASRTIEVQGDDGVVIGTLIANHNGYSTKAYPDATSTWSPQITHLMRLVPTDPNQWEIFNVDWIWEPAPETSIKWQNQGTAHKQEDYHHLRRAWIALNSTTDVTLTLTADGVDYTYTIPSTSGVYAKIMIPLQAVKAKIWVYKFTSTSPFRLYMNDSAVEVIGWGQTGPYQNVHPFGAPHNNEGPAYTQARI